MKHLGYRVEYVTATGPSWSDVVCTQSEAEILAATLREAGYQVNAVFRVQDSPVSWGAVQYGPTPRWLGRL